MALLASWLFGSLAFVDGCSRVQMMRGHWPEAGELVRAQRGDTSSAAAMETAKSYLDTLDNSRRRSFPLAAAALVLGAAMTVMAARAMAGRRGARELLMQLVLAQALLAVITYVALPDVRRAAIGFELAVQQDAFAASPKPGDEIGQQVFQIMHGWVLRLTTLLPMIRLALGSLASVIVLLALTRARVRAFFEASAKAQSSSASE